MHQDAVQEAMVVTIFMGGLSEGVARTELFRSHPETFEQAVTIALRAEFNHKSARASTPVYRTSAWTPPITSNGPEPMDLNLVEVGGEVFQTVEQQSTGRPILRYYMCGSTRHLRPACPLRNTRKARRSTNSDPYQISGTVRENIDTQ